MHTSLDNIRWVTASKLLRLNRRITAATSEPFQLLSEHLLESAVSVPQFHFLYGAEDRMPGLAAHLLRAVGKNHPFAQGNKRTAFHGALVFLEANGWKVSLPDTEDVAKRAEAFILGEGDFEEMVEFLTASSKSFLV